MISNEMQKSSFFTLRREGMVCLFLALTVLAVYWQVGNHEFVNYDDKDYITENQHVQAGLTLKSIAWAFTSTHADNWHPLTWLSGKAPLLRRFLPFILFMLNRLPGLRNARMF